MSPTGRALECEICDKTFTQKSSLIRHAKRCTPGPAPSLRQKSCRQCATSKTKCDLKRPRCSRCTDKNAACEYFIPLTKGNRTTVSATPGPESQVDVESVSAGLLNATSVQLVNPILSAPECSSNDPIAFHSDVPKSFMLAAAADIPIFRIPSEKEPRLTFLEPVGVDTRPYHPTPNEVSALGGDTLALLDSVLSGSISTPANRDLIVDDWITSVMPSLDTIPPMTRHSVEYLLRVMKTWPRMLAKGLQAPPMFHIFQLQPDVILQPLANCITICKMWAGQCEGASEIVRQTIIQEMKSLFAKYRNVDGPPLLATIQALVTYTILLFFPSRAQPAVSTVDPAIFSSLQKVVYHVAQTGLLLGEERDHERPIWECWVQVTAKRRSVMTLYLLHWCYSVHHGLHSLDCEEVGFMLAPAPKYLWQCERRDMWEALYMRWLAQWGERPYLMREFVGVQPGPVVDSRTETWLEQADEFGVMFFAIVNAAEREEFFHVPSTSDFLPKDRMIRTEDMTMSFAA